MDLLGEFLRHFRVSVEQSSLETLGYVARAFSRIPYENITKIIKRAEVGSDEKARRSPQEVISDHIRWGTGGTCFSLTAALQRLARGLGLETEYILADRPYGQNTHCALQIRIDGNPYLLDPGFLLVDPVPLWKFTRGVIPTSGGLSLKEHREIATGVGSVLLIPEENGKKLALETVFGGKRVRRFTYKTAPADEGEFLKAWTASFQWEMMRYLLLTRWTNAGQIYLRGAMLQLRDAKTVNRQNIPEEKLAETISNEFHIHPSIVARALSLLR